MLDHLLRPMRRRRAREITTVLLHQCGKVGSSSLQATLASSAPDILTRHVHFMSREYIDRVKAIARHPDIPEHMAALYEHHVNIALESRQLLAASPPERIVVAAGFRDPLDRAISAYFQNIRDFLPTLTFAPEEAEREWEMADAEFTRLFRVAARGEADHYNDAIGKWLLIDTSLHWFDIELHALYGLDPYERSIGEAAFKVWRHRGMLFFVYRFENLARARAALMDRLPLARRVMTDANVSANKPYKMLLKTFRERFRPDREMWEYYYTSRFYRHFYAGARPAYPDPRPRAT